MKNQQVISMVKVIIKCGKIRKFKEYIKKLTKSARNEKYNLLYQWTQVSSNKFILIQKYKNYQGFLNHLKTPIIKSWENRDKFSFLDEKEKYWVSPIQDNFEVSKII